MKLINVRLNETDERMATDLRRCGVPVSDIVRRAIRAEYERRMGRRRTGRAVVELVAEIIRRHPDRSDRPPVDLTDRHAVSRFIRAKLRRRRP